MVTVGLIYHRMDVIRELRIDADNSKRRQEYLEGLKRNIREKEGEEKESTGKCCRAVPCVCCVFVPPNPSRSYPMDEEACL